MTVIVNIIPCLAHDNYIYTELFLACTYSEEEQFTFIPRDKDPTNKMPKKQKQRAKKAVKNTIKAIAPKPIVEGEKEEKPSCWGRLSCCRRNRREKLVEEEEEVREEVVLSTEISPEMQKASNEGLNMVKNIVFPSLPALLQDLWVYLELIISIIAFAFGLLDIFPIEDGLAFNYSYFGLATISMILAFIDAFIYFFQLGSCARGIRACRRKFGEGKEEGDEEDEDKEDDDENAQKKCCGLSKKWKERFNTWFEFGRNLLTELLLYPLLIFDMFDFITDTGYQPEGNLGRTDFSLFVIGGFYLILSVYIMRIFMVAGSMTSLIRIPTTKSDGKGSDTSLLIKFCAHVLGQIIVHLLIILVIATKINNENRSEDGMVAGAIMNMSIDGNSVMMTNESGASTEQEDSGMNASPFLITAIVLGWVIPVAGIAAFFVVNYYWMKEFSIGFWVNMISLLQGESFAETVFGGEGDAPKKKALEFVEQTQYKKVKKQLERFKKPSLATKFFFPARVPITAITGLLYDIALIGFIVCLMLTYENGSVRVVIFTDDPIMTAVFMISVTIIILANIHILVLLNLILFIVVIIFGLAGAIAIFLSPLLLLVYFPSVACLGYFMLFYEAGTSLKKKENKSEKISTYKLTNEAQNGGSNHNGGSIVLENIAVDMHFDVEDEHFDTQFHLLA